MHPESHGSIGSCVLDVTFYPVQVRWSYSQRPLIDFPFQSFTLSLHDEGYSRDASWTIAKGIYGSFSLLLC